MRSPPYFATCSYRKLPQDAAVGVLDCFSGHRVREELGKTGEAAFVEGFIRTRDVHWGNKHADEVLPMFLCMQSGTFFGRSRVSVRDMFSYFAVM